VNTIVPFGRMRIHAFGWNTPVRRWWRAILLPAGPSEQPIASAPAADEIRNDRRFTSAPRG
jgi:hypothetical protein